jgi:hypothetical protein
MTLRTKARNAFVTAFWAAFWIFVLAALWIWWVVLPGVGALFLAGVL